MLVAPVAMITAPRTVPPAVIPAIASALARVSTGTRLDYARDADRAVSAEWAGHRSVLAVLALDEFGGEVVFGDRDERIGDGDARLVGAFVAVAGASAWTRKTR